MRLGRLLLIYGISLTILLVTGANAGGPELADRMNAGGQLLMIRHAQAPGTGDPADFKIGDCSTQRNLDEGGRNQARALGDWFRSHGISSARIYSSQWCRCLETAELLGLGPVTELPALNSFYERAADRDPNLNSLRKFIAGQASEGKLIILVTHQVTISAITNEYVSSGEGVLLELNANGPFKVVERVGFD